MRFIIVGLGNPGLEYDGSRHNAGKSVLTFLQKQLQFSAWKEDLKKKSEISEGKIGKHEVVLVFPSTFMNKSGLVLPFFIKSKAERERLLVIYDDLDLPIGKIKLSYGRNSGGHRGLESVIKNLKSKDFLRLRIGVSPKTPSGKVKKPTGEKAVIDFILGKFKPIENDYLKDVYKKTSKIIENFVLKGKDAATMAANSPD